MTASLEDVNAGARSRMRPAVPTWRLRVLATSGAVLALAASGWLAFWLLLRIPLLTVTIGVALLLTALVEPLARWLRRWKVPSALAAVLCVLLLLAILTGVGVLVGFRAAAKLRDLTQPLTAGIDRVRSTQGPTVTEA